MNRLHLAAALCVMASVAAAVPASAGPRNPITVTYRDLNPNTPSGARLLLGRIESAAEKVCGGDPWKRRYTPDTTIETREFTKCLAATVAQAVASMNAPLVRQAYDGSIRDNRTMAMR